MTYKIFSPKDYKTSQWSGGQTTELLILPLSASYKAMNFDMRLSSASVELDSSTFTPLPGITRFISPLDGPLTLCHPGQAPLELWPFECYRFDGGLKTESQGCVQDFNLMCPDHLLSALWTKTLDSSPKALGLTGQETYIVLYAPLEDVWVYGPEKIVLKKNHTLLIEGSCPLEAACPQGTTLYVATLKV